MQGEVEISRLCFFSFYSLLSPLNIMFKYEICKYLVLHRLIQSNGLVNKLSNVITSVLFLNKCAQDVIKDKD